MSRQRYETAADLKREEDVIRRVALALGLDYRKATVQYANQYDFFLTYFGKVRAFVEVKCRDIEWGQYPDIMLSLAKWTKGHHWAEHANIPWMLAIRTNDDQVHVVQIWKGWANELEPDFEARLKNTRDEGDIEPVVHIPNQWFMTLEDLSEQQRDRFGKGWNPLALQPYPNDRECEFRSRYH